MSDLVRSMPLQTQQLIEYLAHQAPTLADLSPEQAEAVARTVLAEDLKREMQRAVLAARISLSTEVETFLADQQSPHTARAYRTALTKYSQWLSQRGYSVVDVTPARADDYIRDLRADGGDSDSIRLRVAVASSFHRYLERRYREVQNPFRGTAARPKSTWATATIPTPEEVEVILATASAPIRAAMRILLTTGLRIGALVNLQVRADGSYVTASKGKRVLSREPLDTETLTTLRNSGLPVARPFAPGPQSQDDAALEVEIRITKLWTSRVRRHIEDLKKRGQIGEVYSPHDLRHYFAQTHLSCGLHWLADRLGHSSVSVTERYLRNVLGVDTSAM